MNPESDVNSDGSDEPDEPDDGTVNVPYLLRNGEHLERAMQARVADIRRDLARLLQQQQQQDSYNSSSYSVFYSFPLLGLSLQQSPDQLRQLGLEVALRPEVLQRLRGLTRLDDFLAALKQQQP